MNPPILFAFFVNQTAAGLGQPLIHTVSVPPAI